MFQNLKLENIDQKIIDKKIKMQKISLRAMFKVQLSNQHYGFH